MPGWLLIVLVLALALAPLLQFLPSRQQRSEARLRQAAAVAGLFVEFRQPPVPAGLHGEEEAEARRSIYYGLRLPASRGRPRSRASWWRRGGHWQRTAGAATLPAAVAVLPPWALGAALDEASCGIFWRETAGEEAVAAIAAALESWRDGEP